MCLMYVLTIVCLIFITGNFSYYILSPTIHCVFVLIVTQLRPSEEQIKKHVSLNRSLS